MESYIVNSKNSNINNVFVNNEIIFFQSLNHTIDTPQTLDIAATVKFPLNQRIEKHY